MLDLKEADSQLAAIENGAAPQHTLVAVVRGIITALLGSAGSSVALEDLTGKQAGPIDDAAIEDAQAAAIASTTDADPLAFARNSAPPVAPDEIVPKVREIVKLLRSGDEWLDFFRRGNLDPLAALAGVVASRLEDIVGPDPAS